MAYSNLRKRDMFVENELTKYLDKSLYKRKDIFSQTDRIKNLDLQYNGVDIILSIPCLNLFEIKVDEKAQLREKYIGNPRPTFILELSFENSANNIQKGWFLDENILTDYYQFIWIDKAKCKDFIKEEDFETIDFCLVSRQKLINYFNNKGFTFNRLMEIENTIRTSGENCNISDNDFYFYYTKDLPEKPINIVVKKYVYQNLADISGTISRDYEKRVFHFDLKMTNVNK